MVYVAVSWTGATGGRRKWPSHFQVTIIINASAANTATQTITNPYPLVHNMATLAASAQRHLTEAAGLVFSVADTAHGVPEAMRDNLFEPFVTGRPEGTGLGLAIVREIAEAHGGTARAIHRYDGTTFVLELPWRAS